VPHRDGEKLDRMIATLVIMLPSSHEGGELVVRHDGQERTIDVGADDEAAFRIHFAAFYADCEHEVRPLRKGHRLCLVYNLKYEMGEVHESSLTVDHLSDSDGNPLPIGKLSVDEAEVLDVESLKDVDPEQAFEGYTGNAGMTLERWYRHAAILVWPVTRHFEILCDREKPQGTLPGRDALARLVPRATGRARGSAPSGTDRLPPRGRDQVRLP
jgi:hypothetical protein